MLTLFLLLFKRINRKDLSRKIGGGGLFIRGKNVSLKCEVSLLTSHFYLKQNILNGSLVITGMIKINI